MKYGTVLCIFLFPVFASAQQKMSPDSLARATLKDLIDSWTLGIDSASDAVDIQVYNKFKSLFDVNATIDDDFNVFYQLESKKRTGTYLIKTGVKPKGFDDYAHDVALQIKSLSIDSVVQLDSNTIDPKNMTFTVRKTVGFQKARHDVLPDTYADEVLSGRTIEFEGEKDSSTVLTGLSTVISANQEALYRFTSINTLRISMAFDMDTVRITGIKTISTEVMCTNDADHDAVLNQEDSAINKFGDFTAHGMPDYDLDAVPDETDKCKFAFGDQKNQGCPPSYFFTKNEFDVFIGVQLNAVNINLPALNELGYLVASGNNAMDVLQSKRGVLKNPGLRSGVSAGGNFTYYFGQKRKRRGISIGFTYSGIDAEYQLAEPIVYTYKAFDGVNNYRRQITISSLKEAVHYDVFNIPVMLNYRMHLNKNGRSVLNLQVGPSLMMFRNTSRFNAAIDFGGIYQIDTIRKSAIAYYDYFDRGSTYNIFLTAGNINLQNPNPGADNVFAQLNAKNFDFANNKTYNGKQKLSRITAALNVAIDLQHKISEGLTIKVGPHFTYAPLLKNKYRYKPVDKTTDEYQSIYKGNAHAGYDAFGINVGFIYNF